jgi:hypothetical protein
MMEQSVSTQPTDYYNKELPYPERILAILNSATLNNEPKF